MSHPSFAQAACIALLSSTALSACLPEPVAAAQSVVVIAGATRHEPQLPANTYLTYLRGLGEGSTVAVLTSEGTPRIVLKRRLVGLPTSERERELEIDSTISEVQNAIRTATTPTSPETNQAEAITQAAAILADAKGSKLLVVQGNMLQTTGNYPMQSGVLSLSPEEIAASVRPDDKSLAGVEVVLTGLGQVQGDQQVPTAEDRGTLATFWTTWLDAKGARVTVRSPEPTVERPEGSEPVQVVPFTRPVAPTPTCSAELGSNTVQFVADKADFIDPDRARATIAGVADGLRQCPGRVVIRGTTSGWQGGSVPLSQARAEAVAEVLALDLGRSVESFDVKGVGFDLAGGLVVQDQLSDGTHDPVLMASNRKVLVSVVPK